MNHIPWEQLGVRHEQLGQELTQPALDSHKRQALQREYGLLGSLLQQHNAITKIEAEQEEIRTQLATTSDAEFAELLQEEIDLLEVKRTQAREALDKVLFPPDEMDDRAVFLEIRAGTGGQEAALFAGDLMRMYLMFANKRGWDASIASESPTDLGGYREVVLQIKGKGLYGYLKRESGVHRVQRVPATETAGRIHTSTATVAVLPEATDVDVALDPRDLRIDVYRSSGAGGQHVNTTDSAVRITHIPTGLAVACQDERSQHKNKAKALKILQARLFAAYQEKKAAEERAQRKTLIGTGERSEKVRTYNFPQNRVTDHQADITLKSLDMVMEGNLDPIIDALQVLNETERRSRGLPWLQAE